MRCGGTIISHVMRNCKTLDSRWDLYFSMSSIRLVLRSSVAGLAPTGDVIMREKRSRMIKTRKECGKQQEGRNPPTQPRATTGVSGLLFREHNYSFATPRTPLRFTREQRNERVNSKTACMRKNSRGARELENT